jgi:hypothetical protein
MCAWEGLVGRLHPKVELWRPLRREGGGGWDYSISDLKNAIVNNDNVCVAASVPDPKLLIADPDPQIENQ